MKFILPDMTKIPSGSFWMGSDNGPSNETPRHRVHLGTFRMARYPVSRLEYKLFLTDTARAAPPWWDEPLFRAPDSPAVGINWFDATDYCGWLTGISGTTVRLPTEAERERAARGGTKDVNYPWGRDLPNNHAGGRTHPVGTVGSQDGPNYFGLYDMSGGVHEWCSDYFDPKYYRTSPPADPQGPETGTRRVARGGAWRHAVRYSRCATRSSLAPEKHFSDFGFRCAGNRE